MTRHLRSITIPRIGPMGLMSMLIVLPLLFGCEGEIPTVPLDEPDTGSPSDPPGGGDPADPAPGYTVVMGTDHTLPDWALPVDFGGYVDHPVAGRGQAYRNWWVNWADLEPARGQYDWSMLESVLDDAEEGGYRIVLQIRSIMCGGGDAERGEVVPNAIPAWVFEDFALDEQGIAIGGESSLRIIPAWREDIRTAFNELIRALGEAGYPDRPALGGAYIHGVSSSRGEEFWLEPWQVALLESQAGFSAAVLQEWIESRMDAFRDAFGPHVSKVAWVGKNDIWHYSGADYANVASELVDYPWSIGAGNRSSIVEKYHIALEEPALGQWVDEDGYLHTDESIAAIADDRYFGDENEEYGPAWEWRYGAGDEWQRYRFAVLRALQMQMRFLWTSAAAEQIDPAMSRYVGISLGQTVETSADAWCYLKESAVGGWVTPVGVVKNFERWLRQRDLPGGMTVATERVDRAFNAGNISDGSEGAFYDYTARRTDLANGQNSIFFDLDDRFMSAGSVEVKVEVIDYGEASWRIQYQHQDGHLQESDTYTGRMDGETRTVCFRIDEGQFRGGLQHQMDFRILCDGPGDVVVRWVRVVRTGDQR